MAEELLRVLLISGSTRSGSTNTALLRTAIAVAPETMTCVLYDGLTRLPHFNPDDDVPGALAAPVVALREQLGAADAVLFCTPEYAGALPGSFKNLLDWCVGGGELYGLPAGWVNVAGVAAPTGGASAHASLATVLGWVGADVVEAACVRIPVARDEIGGDGTVGDPAVRAGIAEVLSALVAPRS